MVKQLRESRGWSQSQLAEEVGVSQTCISYIEAGTKSPTIKILKKIAETLDVSIDSLIKT